MSPRVLIGLALLAAAGLVTWLVLSLGDREGGRSPSDAGTAAAAPSARASAGLLAPEGAAPGAGAGREDVEASAAPIAGVAPTAAALDPRESAIVGRVVDEERAPLAGARVAVGGVRDSAPSLHNARALGQLVWLREVEGDADGRFRVDGVPSFGLQLHLEVVAPERPPLEVPALLVLPGDVTDLGELVLARGGGVRGYAVDELGNPVSDAPVLWTHAFGGNWSFFRRRVLGSSAGRTDGQGAFDIAGLPAGLVALAVVSETGSAAWSLPLRIHPDQMLEDVEILVKRGRPVLGDVVAAQGGPVAAARVIARPQGPGPAALEGETEDDGSFALPGGAPGQRYVLDVSAEGYRVKQVGRLRLPPPGQPDERIAVELLPAATVRVSVRDVATGLPVEGAQVAWVGNGSLAGWGDRERNPLRFGEARTLGRTDAEGTLLLDDVRDLAQALFVRAEGYAPTRVLLGRSNGDPDTSPIDVLVKLDRGAALTVRVRDFAGPVADAGVELRHLASEPLSSRSSRVPRSGRAAAPTSGADPHGLSRPLLLRGRTDADGVCTFEHLPPDRYVVTARAEGHAHTLSEPTPIELGYASYDVSLYLPRAAALRGTVLVRGVPTPDQAVVAVAADGLTHVSITDAEGRYALEELPPGDLVVGAWASLPFSALELLVTASSRQRDERRVEVSLVEGEERVLDLEGESDGVTLSGSLLLNHEPRPGAIVRAEEITEEGKRTDSGRNRFARLSGAQATTGPDGTFALTRLPPGRYSVSAELTDTRGSRVRVAQMEVLVGDSDLTQDLSGAVTGLVVDLVMPSDTPPQRRMAVSLRPDASQGGVPGFGAGERWSLSVGRGLRASAELLPEGDYFLEVRGRSLFAPPRELALRAGRIEELEIALQKR